MSDLLSDKKLKLDDSAAENNSFLAKRKQNDKKMKIKCVMPATA